jgi:hypothetical protein
MSDNVTLKAPEPRTLNPKVADAVPVEESAKPPVATETERKKDQGQKIIANMGLFWKREKIRLRGKKGRPSQLVGVRAIAKRADPVDFWKQTGIYALYDGNYRLVYVGQAGLGDQHCIGDRLKEHSTGDLAGRWEMVSWFGLRGVNKGTNMLREPAAVKFTTLPELANVLEGILIEVAEPPMNKQKGRFGTWVERYLQVDDAVDSEVESQKKTQALIEHFDKKLAAIRKCLLKQS